MKKLLQLFFALLGFTTFAQRISVSDITESRSTSDDSYSNKCDVILKVSGDEVRKYKFVKLLKITEAIDDNDIDMVKEEEETSDYREIEQDAKIIVGLKTASRKAEVIKKIAGEVLLYNPSESNGGLIKIANITSKTNTNLLPNNSPLQVVYLTKESYEKYVKENKDKKEEELKKLPEFARKMAEGLLSAFEGIGTFGGNENSVEAYFYVSGETSKLVDLYFVDASGKKIETNGESNYNNLKTFSLDTKPLATWKLILNVETANSVKKIPFTLSNIELP